VKTIHNDNSEVEPLGGEKGGDSLSRLRLSGCCWSPFQIMANVFGTL
jgi:hypothetical protein